MAEYITAAELRNRLTLAGEEFVADLDQSGSGVNDAEIAATITPAIQYAGTLMDEAIASFAPPATARAANNAWMKDRVLDIAVARAVENGGGKVPASLRRAAEESKEKLESVRRGELIIPGFAYPLPGDGLGQNVIGPRVRNVR